MIRRLLHIVLLVIPSFIIAQKIDIEQVKELNREAIQLNREGQFDQAQELLEDLLIELDEQNAELAYKAVTWQTLAKVVMNQGNYERSFELARRSLSYGLARPDSLNIADNLNTIGINHYFLSDYDSTTYYYEKSLEIKRKISKDLYSLAVSEYNLGIVYEDLGMPDKALEFYLAAEENLLNCGIEKTFLSDVYVGMAHIHFYSGDTERAESYAEKSLQEGLESYGPENPNITFIYTSYANILEYQERYTESIELLEKSLNLRRKGYGEYHRWTCETYYDLANVYRLDGQFEKAEELYKNAIRIGEQIGNRQYLSYARTYLAGLYLEQEKNLKEAEQLLNTSLIDQTEIFGEKNEVIAEIYSRLANRSRILKDEKGFFENIEKSFSAANYRSDSIQKVIAPFHALETVLLISQWHEDRFQEEERFEELEDAYDLLDQQTRLINHIQRNFSTDRSKINLANEYRRVFESGIRLCWRLFTETGDAVYLEKAFDLSEINRNSTLLSGLKDIQNKLLIEMSEEDIHAEKKLRSELEKVKMDLYYEKSAENPDKVFLNELLGERINLTASLDSLNGILTFKYPKYNYLQDQSKDINLSDIQVKLGQKGQLLAYFLGNDEMYTFSITADTVILKRSENAKDLIQKTIEFKKQITDRSDILSVSTELFTMLVGGIVDDKKSDLYLVPDNVLNYVPYELLTDSLGNRLIEKHAISYSAGARIFVELQNDFFQYESKANWVGFAPSYEDGLQLFSNQDEVTSIAKDTRGKTFLGEDATREAFLENNEHYKVLHLATHAEIDNNNPLYNKLIFADGDLTSSEIYISGTRAQLAVLSACNTGFGKLEKGEGVMSMARAFHFSGVPSVVMSLWKVPDRSTKEIMKLFYKHLNQGESKSVALQKAKLDYLSSTEDHQLRHPYYWAGFVINGNTETMKLNSLNWKYAIGASGLLLLLGGAWVLLRRRAT